MTDIIIAIIATAFLTSIIAFFFLLLGMTIEETRHRDEWGEDDDDSD